MSILSTAAFSFVFTTASAAAPVAQPISQLSKPEPSPEISESTPVTDAPAATDGIRQLLRARHTADLPDRSALDAHEGAEAALQWLARYGETLVEAERAAALLSLYPTESSREVCMALLSGNGHAKVRAGAARCLSTQPGEAIGPSLVMALQDPDLRVASAGATALKSHPDIVAGLAPALVDALPETVRAQLQ